MNPQRRTHLKWLAAALAAASAPVWAQSVAEQAGALEKKDKKAVPLPKEGSLFALPPAVELIDGTTVQTKDWAGKVVVLEYWATWCPFCARQMPHVEALYQKEHHRGLEVLALSIDKKAADIPLFIKTKNYTFPVAWLSPALAKVLPKPAGLPVTIVIGRDGRVKLAESGEMFAEDLAGIAKFL
ncbi:MAG: TlpA family protein disulfide reductase [Thiomonas sp.]